MSKRFQIVSESILEAYASLNSTSGPIWARFRPQNPSQNGVQNWSKIALEGYPRPKPPPKAILEASETSPSPFSKPPRRRFLYFLAKQRNSLSYWQATMVAIVWTTKWADFAITVLFFALIFWDASALANMFASQISMLTLRNLFRRRFLFG